LPSLTALRLSGSGTISAHGIDASRLTVNLPGSGVISASGKADQLDVTVSGSGEAQLDTITAHTVHAVLSGSATIFVHAANSLVASIPASGSGSIVYLGHPQHLSTTITGHGVIVPGASQG